MVTKGIQNIQISAMLNYAAHMDEIIICDIGFPIPQGVDYVDLVVKDDMPTILDVLDEVLKNFSVEEIVVANEMAFYNPSFAQKIEERFESDVIRTRISHVEFKQRSHSAKGIIRTGDYTANSNIILVSADSGKFHREQNGGKKMQ